MTKLEHISVVYLALRFRNSREVILGSLKNVLLRMAQEKASKISRQLYILCKEWFIENTEIKQGSTLLTQRDSVKSTVFLMQYITKKLETFFYVVPYVQ